MYSFVKNIDFLEFLNFLTGLVLVSYKTVSYKKTCSAIIEFFANIDNHLAFRSSSALR